MATATNLEASPTAWVSLLPRGKFHLEMNVQCINHLQFIWVHQHFHGKTAVYSTIYQHCTVQTAGLHRKLNSCIARGLQGLQGARPCDDVSLIPARSRGRMLTRSLLSLLYWLRKPKCRACLPCDIMALKGRAKAEPKHQWGTQNLVGSEVINEEMDGKWLN